MTLLCVAQKLINSDYERPRVEMWVRHGPETIPLYETGASISAISQRLLDQMRVQKKQERLTELLDDITAINAETMLINGCHEFQLRILEINILREPSSFCQT